MQGKDIRCLSTHCFCKNRIIWLLTSKVLVSANGVENTTVYYCLRFSSVVTTFQKSIRVCCMNACTQTAIRFSI